MRGQIRVVGAALTGALLLGACVSDQAAEVEERVTGMDWRLLGRCLGEPHERDFDPAEGDREIWTYQLPGFSESTDVEIAVHGHGGQASAGAMTSRTGSFASRPGYCNFRFVVDGGSVTSVTVRGRDSQGMNSDARCMRKLRPCVPEREPLR